MVFNKVGRLFQKGGHIVRAGQWVKFCSEAQGIQGFLCFIHIADDGHVVRLAFGIILPCPDDPIPDGHTTALVESDGHFAGLMPCIQSPDTRVKHGQVITVDDLILPPDVKGVSMVVVAGKDIGNMVGKLGLTACIPFKDKRARILARAMRPEVGHKTPVYSGCCQSKTITGLRWMQIFHIRGISLWDKLKLSHLHKFWRSTSASCIWLAEKEAWASGLFAVCFWERRMSCSMTAPRRTGKPE